MRVLLINNHEQIGGGSERVYQGTARLLIEAGHEVATLSCGTEPFDSKTQSVLLPLNGYIDRRSVVQTARNLARYVYWPRAASAVTDLVERFKPDVAHLHIFYGQLSSSILPALKKLGVPTVMTVHEYRMLCPVSTLYTPRLGVCERCATGDYRHAVVQRCNRGHVAASALSAVEAKVRDRWFSYLDYINRFLMVSRFCLQKHVQYRPEIESRSSVLQNFVEASEVIGQPDPVDRIVLYAGRLSPEKGLELLCEAFASLPPGAGRLEIAGAGPLEETLRRRFAQDPAIRFLGRLDAKELAQRMRRAWVTVAPSVWYENNPMAVLESMAQGTPVIGASIGGIPDIIAHGESGWFFTASSHQSLRSRLEEALGIDLERRLSMGQAAWLHVRTHNAPDVHLSSLLGTYQLAGDR